MIRVVTRGNDATTTDDVIATPRSVVGIIPAAGRGVRLRAERPKALVELGGVTLVDRSVAAMTASRVVDRVVVVVPAESVESLAGHFGPDVTVVAGGVERSDSVRAGLDAAGDAEYVLVHDAARTLTPRAVFERVVARLHDGAAAVIPVLPVTDTIKAVDHDVVVGTPDRTTLRAVQTPQGFRTATLRAANARFGDATDDAGLVERLGERVHTVAGDPLAFKITHPLDLVLAEALLAQRGSGDVAVGSRRAR